jgi:hypothetical protein
LVIIIIEVTQKLNGSLQKLAVMKKAASMYGQPFYLDGNDLDLESIHEG